MLIYIITYWVRRDVTGKEKEVGKNKGRSEE